MGVHTAAVTSTEDLRLKARLAFWTALAVGALVVAPAVKANTGHRAHVHGVASMSLSLDATELLIELELPLDTLVGFERAPRTPAEREAAAAVLTRLRETAQAFRLWPEGACRVQEAAVQAPVLEGAAAPREGHADAKVQVRWQCNAGTPPQRLDVLLFGSFKRLERVNVQMVLPQGQRKAVVRRAAPELSLQGTR